MNSSKIKFYCGLTVVVVVLGLLVTGSPVLTIALDSKNSIPLGTFITNAGIIALPLTMYFGVKEFRQPTKSVYKYLSILLKVAIVVAILWIPICYALAGNISFTFSEKETFQGGQLAMKWFWYISYGVVIIPLFILLIHWLLLFLNKFK